MKAVIPAAGLGTRFLPATKSTPKEMIPLVDKPAIQYVVEEAVESGIEDILIVTARGKRAIEDHFDRAVELEEQLGARGKDSTIKALHELEQMADIHFIRQREPLGLGHAILCADRHIGEDSFAVLLGDDVVMNPGGPPATKQLMDACREHGQGIIGVQEVDPSLVDRYGILEVDAADTTGCMNIRNVVEKPPVGKAPSNLAAIGRYAFTPTLFDALRETQAGVGGEIQLADAVMRMLPKQACLAKVIEGTRYDLGTPRSWIESTVRVALQRNDLGDDLVGSLRRILDGA